MYPFERFTEAAKKVLTLAQEEAERSHHSYIGTEHLLLGLLREGESLAAKVLSNLGLEITKVRSAIESVLGSNERIIIQQIIPTSRVKKVMEMSFEEARRMGDDYVGAEHLLLGLLLEGKGVAAQVLRDLGAPLARVRDELSRQLQEMPPKAAARGDVPPTDESALNPASSSAPDSARAAALRAAAAALPVPLRELLDETSARALFARHGTAQTLVQAELQGDVAVSYRHLVLLDLRLDTATVEEWEAARSAAERLDGIGDAAFINGAQLRLRVGNVKLVITWPGGGDAALVDAGRHVAEQLRGTLGRH